MRLFKSKHLTGGNFSRVAGCMKLNHHHQRFTLTCPSRGIELNSSGIMTAGKGRTIGTRESALTNSDPRLTGFVLITQGFLPACKLWTFQRVCDENRSTTHFMNGFIYGSTAKRPHVVGLLEVDIGRTLSSRATGTPMCWASSLSSDAACGLAESKCSMPKGAYLCRN